MNFESMPQVKKTLIMKFGGASVADPEQFSSLASLIIKKSSIYSQVAVVVSAMGGMTDQLISLARKVNPTPPKREYDMLVSVGERISISLLAMALAAKGKEAVSFTGSQSGIITCNEHSEAKILDVQPYRLLKPLHEGKVVIVAGFQGVSVEKEITTLGRGGSDTTAVALAIALNAEKVEFYKDVPGIFAQDPKQVAFQEPYPFLSHSEALEIVEKSGGKVLHPRAVRLAFSHALPLHVISFQDLSLPGTLIQSDRPSQNSLKGRYEV